MDERSESIGGPGASSASERETANAVSEANLDGRAERVHRWSRSEQCE
ncbi:hypothetical protein [Halogeometricum sp. CBA1124]|nr:hypothetical protein [Halogeometricum sp. CBA1124]MUV58548.1 hypothetical protein [Halogeometricum sp. CBA1124]